VIQYLISIWLFNLTERTWWRLLQKHIVCIWLSVPDGGYYRNASCTFDWAYLMEVTTETHRVHLTERTWLRLLQKHIVYIWLSVPDGGYYRNTSCTFDWAYLMEVTTEIHRVHSFYLFAYYFFLHESHIKIIFGKYRIFSCLKN
jgi:hypothetical protein